MSTDLVFEAILTGFILSIMIGPVFFLLLETSIVKGIRAAIAFDVGVLLSDVIYILIAYLFYSKVESLSEGNSSLWMKIIGGSLFLAYGIYRLLTQTGEKALTNEQGKIIHTTKDYRHLVIKGFILNFANPMVIFYWFSVMTLAARTTSEESAPVLLFLTVVLGTFIAFDLLKIVGAKQLRPLVTDRLLKGLNQLIGIVFIGFGLFLAVQGITEKL
jgi:threonine/homoserine/homoserine lactone efflux protein